MVHLYPVLNQWDQQPSTLSLMMLPRKRTKVHNNYCKLLGLTIVTCINRFCVLFLVMSLIMAKLILNIIATPSATSHMVMARLSQCSSFPIHYLLTRCLSFSSANVLPKELEDVRAIKNARLIVSAESECKLISSQPVLPLVVGWTESSHRALSKYAAVYSQHGLHAVTMCTSLIQTWSSKRADTNSSSLLKSLNSSLAQPTKLLVHSFSAGPLAILPSLHSLLPKCLNLSLGGIIFECAPSNFSFQSGTAASVQMYKQGGFSLPVHLFASSVGTMVNILIGRKRRQELKDCLESPILSDIPMLFLYGDSDIVAKVEWVDSVIKDQEKMGRNVERHCFKGGVHLRNVLTHPQEYHDVLSNFLNKHYL